MQKKIINYVTFLSKQPRGTIIPGTKKEKPKQKTNVEQLAELKKKYHACTQCPLATQGRTNVVFGHGNPKAELMLIGEGPGRDEDLQALPFVGRAGKLLTKIIEAMGMKREDVYISNVVKCRPPHNRAPLPSESEICKHAILFREIDIIKPKIICTLGATATQELLGKPISITKMRGTFIDFHGSLLMPTFHPAYLLRNPSKKAEVWFDMKKVLEKLKKRRLN